ncbi:MAG: response regulator transcription factor [Halobaculum sp.]
MTDNIETVLVAEDERALADRYAEILRADYTVETAYDGEAALAAADETLDAVLLDRRMPGLSGAEVLDRLRDRGYDCPVAMVTAVRPDWEVVEMGFDDYLLKPVGMEELTDAVERLDVLTTVGPDVRTHIRRTVTQAALEGQKDRSVLDEDDRFDRLRRDAAETSVELGDVTADLSPDETELIVDTITRNLASLDGNPRS